MAHAGGGGALEAVLSATSVTSTSSGAAGVSGTLNAVLTATETRTYYQAPATVGWSTLGGAARAGLRGVQRFVPYVGLALTAAELAGWVYEDGWFNKNDGIEPEELTGGSYYCAAPPTWVLSGKYCTATPQAMQSFILGKQFKNGATNLTVTEAVIMDNGAYVRALSYNAAGTLVDAIAISRGSTLPEDYWTPGSRPATQVTEEELAKLIAQDPANHYTMLHDVNGKPHPFPEIVNALNSIADAITNATGASPSVDAEPVIPNETDPSDPAPPGDATGQELPAFCEWAKVVCDFIDWYKKEPKIPEDEEFPYEDISPEAMEDYDSGMSGGTCPAPEIIPVLDGEFELQWDGLCTFVEYLNPLLQGCAWIAAAFIVVNSHPRRF